MRLTRTNQWTAAGILLLGTGLVSALSALLVPAGADTLSALVIAVALALAVASLSVGEGSLLRGSTGVIGAFAVAVLPVVAVVLQIAGVRLLPLTVALQLAIVVGGVLLVVDMTCTRPARAFTAGCGLILVIGLALAVASAGWFPSEQQAVAVAVLVGSWSLAIASVLLGVVLLGAVRLIAVSEQSAHPGASEVTDR